MSRGEQMLMFSLNKRLKRASVTNDFSQMPTMQRLNQEQFCSENKNSLPADDNTGQEMTDAGQQPVSDSSSASRPGDNTSDHGGQQCSVMSLSKTLSSRPKKKRPRTSDDQTAESKAKHPILPPCTAACRRKCHQKIDDSRRVDIHEQFWAKAYDNRRQWIYHHIDRVHVQRRRTTGDSSRTPRESSYLYKLPTDGGIDVFVCKTFFLRTLGYNSDKVISCLMHANGPNILTPGASSRGRHRPSNCVDDTIIVEHVNSFNPQISHYRRKHAPRRRYLSPEITIKSMFAEFEKKYPNFCSYDKYRKVVQELNISFCKLGEEQCEMCLIQSKHRCEALTTDSSLKNSDCAECQQSLEHKELVAKVRQLYTLDKDSPCPADHSYYTVDLQKVLMMPRLPGVKTAVFTRRLVVFNETFAPLKSLDNTVSILWHEGISGRNAADIASTFVFAMKQNPGVAHFTFWMDNCSAQNKNWSIFTAMIVFVNSDSGPQCVTFKFLVTGHTFMSADAFHAKVEKEVRLKNNLYDFDDLKDAVSKANKTVKIVSMDADDFHVWQSGAYSTRRSDRPRIADLYQVRFAKGSRCMHYKLKPDDSEQEYNFLTKKFKLTEPRSRNGNRGIPCTKKNDIVSKLCPLMPDAKQQFWKCLPVSDVPDLIDCDDNDNDSDNDNQCGTGDVE